MTIYKILLLDADDKEVNYPGYYRKEFDTEKDIEVRFPQIPDGFDKALIRTVVLIEIDELDDESTIEIKCSGYLNQK